MHRDACMTTGVTLPHSKEPLEAKRGLEQLPPQSLRREHGAAYTLVSDLWSPEPGLNVFLLF